MTAIGEINLTVICDGEDRQKGKCIDVAQVAIKVVFPCGTTKVRLVCEKHAHWIRKGYLYCAAHPDDVDDIAGVLNASLLGSEEIEPLPTKVGAYGMASVAGFGRLLVALARVCGGQQWFAPTEPRYVDAADISDYVAIYPGLTATADAQTTEGDPR